MTPEILLSTLREVGATCTVIDGELRFVIPKGRCTPELRQSVADNRAELRALLERSAPLPTHGGLGVDDCVADLADMHSRIRADYPAGAMAVLDTDAVLRGRVGRTEDVLDELARTPGGPLEVDWRRAVAAHEAVWREVIARHNARSGRADPMPDLPDDVTFAAGFSYGNGEDGTWSVVKTEAPKEKRP